MPGAITPADEAALAAAVRDAAAAKTPLEIAGGGSRRALGRPVRAEATLSTTALSGITLYEPAALTVVAGAGTRLADLEATLAAEGQRLPFEPMDHRPLLGTAATEPTIGGVVACAVSGPRRVQAGSCRDLLLGVRFVNGRGEAIKSGGRVMKNVTGYDLAKLLCGSYGTLGVITEVAFKVLPRPEAVTVLLIGGLDDARAVAALAAALGSPYDVTGAAHLPVGIDGDPVTMIRLEGFADSVAYRAGRLRGELADYGDIALESDPARTAAGWAHVRDVKSFTGREGAVWRLSVKPSDGPEVVAALREKIEVTGVVYDWGGGLVWLLTAGAGDAGAAAIRDQIARRGGHATLIRADAATRAAVAVFQPEAPALAAISAGLRAKFDPAGILNPGRMGA